MEGPQEEVCPSWGERAKLVRSGSGGQEVVRGWVGKTHGGEEWLGFPSHGAELQMCISIC